MQKEHFIIIGLAVGIIIGGVAGFSFKSCKSCEQANLMSKSDISDKTLIYINKNFLGPKGLEGRIANTTSFGKYLYKLNVEILSGGRILGVQPVYVTKDGGLLILSLANMSEKLEPPRINVSVDDDPYKGSKDAKVIIIEFSDYACPYCAKFELQILPTIMKEYDNKVMFVFRDFPVHGGPSLKAAEAADCAGDQGKFWEYHKLLFEKQTEWYSNLSMLEIYASEVGLNVTKFKECLNSGKYEGEVMKDREDGAKAGVTGTPTIFVNGRKIEGAQPYEVFKQVIDEELGK